VTSTGVAEGKLIAIIEEKYIANKWRRSIGLWRRRAGEASASAGVSAIPPSKADSSLLSAWRRAENGQLKASRSGAKKAA